MSTVPEAALVAVLVSVVVVAAATRRRQRGLRNSAAATTDLTVDHRSVTRTLGDGRVESARWSALESVELVRTPVKTADGASSFLILAETAQLGCLVPLGVGLEREVLERLATLRGFRVEKFNSALEKRPPHREFLWQRPEP